MLTSKGFEDSSFQMVRLDMAARLVCDATGVESIVPNLG